MYAALASRSKTINVKQAWEDNDNSSWYCSQQSVPLQSSTKACESVIKFLQYRSAIKRKKKKICEQMRQKLDVNSCYIVHVFGMFSTAKTWMHL
jgi:hypothetical protein